MAKANNYLDARTDAVGSSIDASICIVGSGAAGITLARELGRTVPGVVLIESGGFDIEGETQSLFKGRNLSLPYYDLTACRLRYFGGTTNHWSGFCRTNDALDYEGRPELGLPKWPINYTDLAPYITRAAQSLDIQSKFFEPHALLAASGNDLGSLVEDHSKILNTKVFQIAKNRKLGPRYREEIGALPNLRVLMHLNATHVQLSPDGGSVRRIDCATLNGKKVTVQAKTFILCCHAIENARLLLVSNDVNRAGVGNQADMVGRNFMDHIHIFASKFIPTSKFPLIYNRQYAAQKSLNANTSFTDTFTAANQLLQYYCRFNPEYASDDVARSYDRVRSGFMKPGSFRYLSDVANVATNIHDVVGYYLSQKRQFGIPAAFEMEHRLEQAPNPDSRVVISDRRDALGSLIADLDWRINEHDVRSFKLGQALMARELSALGWGRAQLENITTDLVKSRVAGHFHQIGTARMSDDAKQGVVDRNCRVHGVGNLYIGGSAVFPTSGYSGPTMMIIGLALRIADHVRSSLGKA